MKLYRAEPGWHKKGVKCICAWSLLGLLFLPALSAPANTNTWPGRQPDGSLLLPNQWSLRPAGRQIEMADFPVNIAVHPGGKFAAVLHAGYGKHEILLVDLSNESVCQRVALRESFYGLAFTRDGRRLFASGAADEWVYMLDFNDGCLESLRRLSLRPKSQRGVPAGVTLSADGHRLYVANLWGGRISLLHLDQPQQPVLDFPLVGSGDLSEAPVAPSADPDTAAAQKRGEALLFNADNHDPFPYACALDERAARLYTSLWGQGAVAVLDLNSGKEQGRWATQEHPCEMVLSRDQRHLFVANANRNTVTVLDTRTGASLETLWAALTPDAPPGSTPNSLALSPDESLLFVANAGNNCVAVFDVRLPGRSRSLGFIPVGWYPTSVRVTPDGRRLLVANGKGLSSKPNPGGPQPGVTKKADATVQYIAGLFRGTLSVIELPRPKDMERQLAAWTVEALKLSPMHPDAQVAATRPPGHPIPARPGEPSPIKYCIYVIKENRTYDQILGDMPEGNGEPKLCLFPEKVTPNHHALAREFVLFDNFYVESEVSADGHEWTMGAYATDFVEKTWPLSYGHGGSGKWPYPSEGRFEIATPAGGYLWDRAAEAGVTYRSYGEFVNNGRTLTNPATTRVKALQDHFDPWFHGFDMTYPDVKRAARFLEELRRFEREGEMPRLQIVRLPSDHTHGTTAGAWSPTALVADNDLALGQLVEGASRSKFWPQTAIFVVEDDAQNGPDHVDAHRTIAYVLSPYTRKRGKDSTLYSTSSMLRTMEMILGMKPMSQFDATARPMFAAFTVKPDMTPYECRPAAVNLNERNPATAWGGAIRFNFAREDAADDLLLNEVIWRSVKGSDSPMPAPVRAGFVRVSREDDMD